MAAFFVWSEGVFGARRLKTMFKFYFRNGKSLIHVVASDIAAIWF